MVSDAGGTQPRPSLINKYLGTARSSDVFVTDIITLIPDIFVVRIAMDVITPIVSTARVLRDVVDIANEIGRATHDYSLGLGTLYAIETSLEDWMRLWANDRIEERMYRYFWGRGGCKDVQARLVLIENDLIEVQNMLDKLRTRELFFAIYYVLLKKRDMKRLLDGLESQVSELAKTTEINYSKRVSNSNRLAATRPDPQQLAILATKSAILSASMESLLASRKSHTLLAMLPDHESGKRYDASLWTQFRDDRVGLSLKTVGNRNMIRTWRMNMRVMKNSVPAETRFELVQDQDHVRNKVDKRSSLQQCLKSISVKRADEQTDVRRATALDRVDAAVDIAEWNLLTWDSDWTARLCICNVHCGLRGTDGIRTDSIFLLGLTKNLVDHGCFDPGLRPNRHLHLAVILAALLIGCQVGVVYSRNRHRRFTVYADGLLLSMGTDEFLTWIDRRCLQNDRWVDAIRGCLDLDKRRRGERPLRPQDFHYYNEHVLKP
jgi:hypothetical protein